MSDTDNDPYTKANSLGLKVVLPEKDQLLIDIDDLNSITKMYDGVTFLNHIGIKTIIEQISPSQNFRNRHVYIRVPGMELSDLQRIALQAMLGSDLKREMLAIRYLMTGIGSNVPSCFFEKIEETKSV